MRIKLILIFLFASTLVLYSQDIVSGTVVGQDDLPIPGATVIFKGATIGTTTDFDGNFSLAAPAVGPKTLIVSYIGFETGEVENVEIGRNYYIRLGAETAVFLIDGANVLPGEFKFEIALKRKQQKYKVWCGGIIVGDKWVVTSAHCFEKRNERGVVIAKIGKKNLKVHYGNRNHLKTEKVRIKNIFRNPELRYNEITLENDLVLLELQETIDFEKYNIEVVELLSKEEYENVLQEDVTAVGWGSTRKDRAPQILKKSSFPILAYEKCLEHNSMKNILKPGMVCFGQSSINIFCPGDSGNGVFYEESGKKKLIGLITLGSKCTTDNNPYARYSVITSILPFREWILDIMGSN